MHAWVARISAIINQQQAASHNHHQAALVLA
jgi:hypothetical protein